MPIDEKLEKIVKVHKNHGRNKLCVEDILKIVSWVRDGFYVSSIVMASGISYSVIKYHCDKYHIKIKKLSGRRVINFPPVQELFFTEGRPFNLINRCSPGIKSDADKSQYIWYIKNCKSLSKKDKKAMIRTFKRERENKQPVIFRLSDGISKLPVID
jgi:hypothetical protein